LAMHQSNYQMNVVQRQSANSITSMLPVKPR
jgi:hypothetical protein